MHSLPYTSSFRTVVRIPHTLGDTQLTLEIKGATADKLENTGRLVSCFATCAEAGMFSGERVHPTKSYLQVASGLSEAKQRRWLLNVHGIDPGAFRILLWALAESSRREGLLEDVTLMGTRASANDLGPDSVLARPFPGRAEIVPFELDLKAFYFGSTEPLIRMEFQRQLEDNEFDQIKFFVDAWDEIVRFGGYSSSSTEVVYSTPEPGEFYLAEPTVLEHPIYAFQGPEEMFNPVINMAVKVHATICPLIALKIE